MGRKPAPAKHKAATPDVPSGDDDSVMSESLLEEIYNVDYPQPTHPYPILWDKGKMNRPRPLLDPPMWVDERWREAAMLAKVDDDWAHVQSIRHPEMRKWVTTDKYTSIMKGHAVRINREQRYKSHSVRGPPGIKVQFIDVSKRDYNWWKSAPKYSYLPVNKLKRKELYNHKRVQGALGRWWNMLQPDQALDVLGKKEFFEFAIAIYYTVTDDKVSAITTQQMVEVEWAQAASGADAKWAPRDQIVKYLFDICDNWTDSVNVDAYVMLLDRLRIDTFARILGDPNMFKSHSSHIKAMNASRSRNNPLSKKVKRDFNAAIANRKNSFEQSLKDIRKQVGKMMIRRNSTGMFHSVLSLDQTSTFLEFTQPREEISALEIVLGLESNGAPARSVANLLSLPLGRGPSPDLLARMDQRTVLVNSNVRPGAVRRAKSAGGTIKTDFVKSLKVVHNDQKDEDHPSELGTTRSHWTEINEIMAKRKRREATVVDEAKLFDLTLDKRMNKLRHRIQRKAEEVFKEPDTRDSHIAARVAGQALSAKPAEHPIQKLDPGHGRGDMSRKPPPASLVARLTKKRVHERLEASEMVEMQFTMKSSAENFYAPQTIEFLGPVNRKFVPRLRSRKVPAHYNVTDLAMVKEDAFKKGSGVLTGGMEELLPQNRYSFKNPGRIPNNPTLGVRSISPHLEPLNNYHSKSAPALRSTPEAKLTSPSPVDQQPSTETFDSPMYVETPTEHMSSNVMPPSDTPSPMQGPMLPPGQEVSAHWEPPKMLSAPVNYIDQGFDEDMARKDQIRVLRSKNLLRDGTFVPQKLTENDVHNIYAMHKKKLLADPYAHPNSARYPQYSSAAEDINSMVTVAKLEPSGSSAFQNMVSPSQYKHFVHARNPDKPRIDYTKRISHHLVQPLNTGADAFKKRSIQEDMYSGEISNRSSASAVSLAPLEEDKEYASDDEFKKAEDVHRKSIAEKMKREAERKAAEQTAEAQEDDATTS